MKAIGLSVYGGPEVLHLVDLPDPHAGAGQVRVRVRAATVNPVDVLLRNGALADWNAGHEPPFVPGMDIAGTIDEIGPDVDTGLDVHVGQDVVGIVDSIGSHGGYSEYVVLPATSVTAIPDGADWPHAASFLMNALAARNAVDLTGLSAGATLLVTGAGGALGGYAVALAHADGLRVIAVDSAIVEQNIRALGADDYVERGEDAAQRVLGVAPDGVDGVVDAALLFDKIAPAIRDGGKLIDLQGRGGDLGRGIEVIHSNVRQRVTDHAAIVRLREQVDAGVLPMRVAHTYPAEAAVQAHQRLAEGKLSGRIVLLFDAPTDGA